MKSVEIQRAGDLENKNVKILDLSVISYIFQKFICMW